MSREINLMVSMLNETAEQGPVNERLNNVNKDTQMLLDTCHLYSPNQLKQQQQQQNASRFINI